MDIYERLSTQVGTTVDIRMVSMVFMEHTLICVRRVL